ncbi:MAG TPA: GntR family transcriptional regulator, partial [Bradyrhizobium sp.]|nr:GntR family transcriptional regulator [Bradyrhizobium sp.]
MMDEGENTTTAGRIAEVLAEGIISGA